jgi:ATP-binding cassette subfamily F protein 3
LTRDRQYEIDRAFIEKERDFIARHHAGQRSKEVKGRQTRLERRLAAGEFVLEKSRSRRTVHFSFDEATSDESTVARIEGLSKSYGGKALFEDLSFRVARGSMFGVTGPNGVGKTTMLKIMMGEVEADAGRIEWGRKLNIGYYAQVTAHLDSGRTVLDEIASLRSEMSKQQIRSYLGGFQFTGDDVFKRIDELSGGEQSRLRLIKLILSGPNVLVLDEPTNHLDIASREALEEALAAFPGTVIAVSHDRYFLDRLVDHLLVLRPEGHRILAGNYSDYIEEVERAREAEREKAKPSRGPSRRRGADGGAGTTPRKAASQYDRLTVDELAAMIEEREERVAALTEQFGDADVYRDPEASRRLQEELEALKAELAEIEAAWADRIENA